MKEKQESALFCSLGIEHVVKGLKCSWRHLVLHKKTFAKVRTDKQKSILTRSLYLMTLLRTET